jgi:DNA-binding CsgD family transcriptional regulator
VAAELSAEVFSGGGRRPHVLCDREDELASLDDAVAQASAGAGGVLLVEGPAGIGKTALLDQLRQRATERGLSVLTARGGELERGFGFGVVRQLLEGAVAGASAAERERLTAGAARLAEPVFTDVAKGETSDVAFATLHGLYWLVVNLTERGPMVLVVDDVHWADEPSLRFLLHLAHRIAGLPVVLVLAVRSGAEKNRRDLDALLLEARPPIVRPRPLGESAVAEMIRARLGQDAGGQLSRACAQATGGNPFLLSELLGEFARKALSVSDIDPATVDTLAPERISAAVLLRVEGLDRDAPALARAVAVLGPRARLSLCAQLADLDPRRARTLAAGLVDQAVLAPGEPLRFVHPIVRTAIYEELSPTEQSDLHAGAARLLVAEGEGLGSVAIHLLATAPNGDRDVVTMLCDASRSALAGGAPDTARALLRRALDEPPDVAERPMVLFELGKAEHEIGDATAPSHLREAAEATTEPVMRARAVEALAWTTHPDARRQREQIALYERSAAEVDQFDRELALELEAARLGALLLNPDLPVRFEDEAERFADMPALTGAECLLRSFVARRALTGGPIAVAGDLAEQAAAHPSLVSQGGHPLWRTNITICLVQAERYEVAEHLLSRAIRHAERKGSPQWLARALWLRGLGRHRRGDLKGAEADARAALDIQSLTYSYNKYPQLVPLIDSLADQGRVDEGEELLAEHGMDGDLSPSLFSILPLLARGRLRAAGGQHASARADLEDALRRIEQSRGMFPWANDARIALVPVLRAIGDEDAALDLAEESFATATAAESRRNVGGALRVRGLLEGGKRGLDLLRQAADTLAESPALVWRAQACVDLGAALRREGRAVEARTVLREGMELAHRCAATPLADHAFDELRAAGGRPRRRAGVGADALTTSERRVAELAARGASNKEIAQSLFVTLRTVEMHLSSVYAKLEIRSRHELGAALGPL